MSVKLKNNIVSTFKMHGLTLKGDAAKYLHDVLSNMEADDQNEHLEKLIESIQKLPLESPVIGREHCELSIADINHEATDENLEVFKVIDVFSIPHFAYNNETKKFTISKVEKSLAPAASSKIKLFLDRYNIIHQRLMRHDLFAPSHVLNAREGTNKFELKTLDYLLGSTTKLGDVIVLGMLTQMKEGIWYLEDPTGIVKLNLSKTNFHTGLFTENSFVLAGGCYDDEIFHVNALGFPPPETSAVSRQFLGNVNLFGGSAELNSNELAKLKQLEMEDDDAMFVFISDLWLDDNKVMQKLRTLFDGYSPTPPTCFVFAGNFLSKAYGLEHSKVLKDAFKTLADLIADFPSLNEASRFVFVPGPQDPGPCPILPRPGIPAFIHEPMTKKVSNCIFASNPCRLRYYSQEIVIFREDIIIKMCRNCLRYPNDNNIPNHFVKTMVCQSHLCPLPLQVEPIFWSYDDALRIYPLPDLIVCCDRFDPYTISQSDCCVTNPGSFARSEFSFKVYWPSSKKVEDSKIFS